MGASVRDTASKMQLWNLCTMELLWFVFHYCTGVLRLTVDSMVVGTSIVDEAGTSGGIH